VLSVLSLCSYPCELLSLFLKFASPCIIIQFK
jgi:hypothetical protein